MAPIQFGVLLIPFQLMDVAGPLDVLSSCSKPYLQSIESFGLLPNLWEKGIDIEFHHIGQTMDPVTHSAGFKSYPTTTCDACPKLDYLLIGGPEPSFIQNMPQVFIDFIASRMDEIKLLFTTCTGGMVAARVGVLDGKNATTNHGAVPMSMQFFPQVKWTKDAQWVCDGKVWSSGGACAGMDMMANWVLQNYRDVAEAGFAALDYEPRDIHGKLVPLRAQVTV